MYNDKHIKRFNCLYNDGLKLSSKLSVSLPFSFDHLINYIRITCYINIFDPKKPENFLDSYYTKYHKSIIYTQEKETVELLKGTGTSNNFAIKLFLEEILLTPYPINGLYGLFVSGIMDKILPSLSNCYGIPQNWERHKFNVFEHILFTVQYVRLQTDNLALLYASLFHDIGKHLHDQTNEIKHFPNHELQSAEIAKTILTSFSYPQYFIDEVLFYIRKHVYFKESRDIFNDKNLKTLEESAKTWKLNTNIDAIVNVVTLYVADHSSYKYPLEYTEINNIWSYIRFYKNTQEQEPVLEHKNRTQLAISVFDIMENFDKIKRTDIDYYIKKLSEWIEQNPDKNNREDLLSHLYDIL